MNHGSLFSGIGGFDLGFERAGFTSAWQVEIDPYCRAVLAKRFQKAERYADIRTVHGPLAHSDGAGSQGKRIRESTAGCGQCLSWVDVITGGFPCQPFSQAGKRMGAEDDRYLWPEMLRVVEEIRPAWVVAENVPGIISMGLDQVLSDLEAAGYETGTLVIPACAVDAPHRRDRIWILAHTQRCADGRLHRGREDENEKALAARCGQALADTKGQPVGAGLRADEQAGERRRRSGDISGATIFDAQRGRCDREPRGGAGTLSSDGCRWPIEPNVGRVAYGIPNRVDRLEALGNAIVPAIAEFIAKAIKQTMNAA